MQALLANHIDAIRIICKTHRVKYLWVFGSVLTDEFSDNSDVDFLYEFDDTNLTPDEELDHLLGFISALQHLLRRNVDMVWQGGLQNPYFKEEVDKNKLLLYAQESEEVLV